ncbi:hypothetical protein BSKO_10447 [Bryopsis sp. KO-2023]|nr:hypothetical protein BSKO_10447 [Bryopsis sp. KO-2023]
MELGVSCMPSFYLASATRHPPVPTTPYVSISRPLFRYWDRLRGVSSKGALLAREKYGFHNKTDQYSRLNAWGENEGTSVVEEEPTEGPSLLEQIERYERKEETEYGTVIIKPLSEEWIPEVSKLLADSFGETLGYRGFSAQIFQQQLVDYLKSSLGLGIAGVILISVLQPNADFEGPDEPSSSGPKFQGFSFIPPPGISIPAANTEKRGGLLGMFGLGGSSEGAGDGKQKTASFRDFRDDLDDMSDAAIEKRWSTSESQPEQVKPEPPRSDASDSVSTSPSTESSTSDFVSGTGQSIELEEPVSVRDAGNQEISILNETPAVEDKQKERECLIGSVELSLDVSTRSMFGGLLTPVKEGAYMCNMAVQPYFQRQGHATRLLNSCEEISRVSDLEELSLHVRIKDEGAKALYRGYGFEDIKQDTMLLSIVGLDPKILMKLRLSS